VKEFSCGHVVAGRVEGVVEIERRIELVLGSKR